MWKSPPDGKHIYFTIIKARCGYKRYIVENTPRVVNEAVIKVSSLRNEILLSGNGTGHTVMSNYQFLRPKYTEATFPNTFS